MTKLVEKRSEILFCYDVTDANPNGDPMDENKPRIDEETGINIVTDVRLKRTIRDYLFDYRGYNGTNGKDILIREIKEENGIQDAKMRAEDFIIVDGKKIDKKAVKNHIAKDKPKDSELLEKMIEIIDKNIKEQCIDIRLFGATLPIEFSTKEKSSITYTGPVQFKIGRSLHPVELKFIKGTGAFASQPGAGHKTFREEYILPYSFIAFHGIINETAAAHTNLSEDDSAELLNALWNGTKNLISRSKFGQMPRLLFRVIYKDRGFFIGDLEKRIQISGIENPLKIRSVKDFTLDISNLLALFDKYGDKIESVEYMVDDTLKLSGELPGSFNRIKLLA
ncbi:MAG: type I-B CRISPR-associated protein Cas7/Csh2 [Candidatus Aminicenantes bacterium]|nr:type I-B CRISPR-associated protein Cas7/Csh2 [Candidatus Aminicenantes bacterium]